MLYLDCDLVVNQDLTPLFDIDLGDYPLAAVQDLGAQYYFNEYIFNSGVMLINNRLWKQEEVCKQLIEMTNDHLAGHEIPHAESAAGLPDMHRDCPGTRKRN